MIWIGGGDYPDGGSEFNLDMDIHAANALFASEAPVWQITKSLYKEFAVSLAELQLKVKPYGAIGDYLFQQMVDFNEFAAKFDYPWPRGEIWGLGDQGTIAVLMEENEKKNYDLVPAPRIAEDMTYVSPREDEPPRREIRVYHKVDARLTLEDFFAKLAINYG